MYTAHVYTQPLNTNTAYIDTAYIVYVSMAILPINACIYNVHDTMYMYMYIYVAPNICYSITPTTRGHLSHQRDSQRQSIHYAYNTPFNKM